MTLSARRRADRQRMALQVQALATSFGFATFLDLAPPCTLRGIAVNIKAPPALLNVRFDGDSSQPNVHVLAWHMAPSATAKFAPTFAPSVNPFHKQKATDIATGFPRLLAILAERFESLRSGAAFLPGQSTNKEHVA